jgi:hypothetical protein
MREAEDAKKLLYKAHQAMGRRLFVLGPVLLTVIVIGLLAPLTLVVYAIENSMPLWMAAGAVASILAAVAAVLRSIPKILGPEGLTGIVKARNDSPIIHLIGSREEDVPQPRTPVSSHPDGVRLQDRSDHRPGPRTRA